MCPFTPTRQVVTWALVIVIAYADLGDDPPAIRRLATPQGRHFVRHAGLHQAVFGAGYGTLYDLAADQLHPFVGRLEEIVYRFQLCCVHDFRLTMT